MINIISPAWQTYPILIPSLLLQKDPDWKLTMLHDGHNEDFIEMTRRYSDPRITVGCTHKRGNVWGHNIRKLLIEEMEDDGDYVVITNHDNYFLPTFISSLKERNEDFVMWDILHNYFDYQQLVAKIQFGHIDISQVGVKKTIAKEVGWQSLDNAGDFPYIQDCYLKSKDRYKIDKNLGIHN